VKIFKASPVFQGKRKVSQKSWMLKIYIQYSETFLGKLYFQGKRKLLKDPEPRKNFQYSVYSLGGDPCNLG